MLEGDLDFGSDVPAHRIDLALETGALALELRVAAQKLEGRVVVIGTPWPSIVSAIET